MAEITDAKRVVTPEELTTFNSLTAVTALLESIHRLALQFCDQSLGERLEATEALYDQFDVFCHSGPACLTHCRGTIGSAETMLNKFITHTAHRKGVQSDRY